MASSMDARISSAGLVQRSCRDYTIAHSPDAAPQGLHMASSPRFHKLSRLRPPHRGMSRLLLKFVQQALLVEQATQPWPSVQGRG